MVKLIDFYANWCAPCKMMAPIIEEIEKEFASTIKVTKVNVDENLELASKYNVLSIPTYVLEKDDKEVERVVGARSKAELVQLIQRYLE